MCMQRDKWSKNRIGERTTKESRGGWDRWHRRDQPKLGVRVVRQGACGGGENALCGPGAAERLPASAGVPAATLPCQWRTSVGWLGCSRPAAGAVGRPAQHTGAAAVAAWASAAAAAGIAAAAAQAQRAAAIAGLAVAAVHPSRHSQRHGQRQERPAVQGSGRRRRRLLRQQALSRKVLQKRGCCAGCRVR